MYTSLTPPRIYAEWVDLLNRLQERSDDEAVLEAMYKGTLEWQSGVADRFTDRLTDVVKSRQDRAVKKFQSDMSHANGQERVIVSAMATLRKEMTFLLRVVSLPALPEDYRKTFREVIQENADELQKSLEESAQRERTGKLLSIVRRSRMNNLEGAEV